MYCYTSVTFSPFVKLYKAV